MVVVIKFESGNLKCWQKKVSRDRTSSYYRRPKKVSVLPPDNSSSVHTDNRQKDILVFGEGPPQGLDNTIRTAEVKYSINCIASKKGFCLSLHYIGNGSFFILLV